MSEHEHHSNKLIATVLLLTFFVGTASGMFGSFVLQKFSHPNTPTFAPDALKEKLASVSTEEEKTVIEVVHKANPAVVSIVISQKVSAGTPDASAFDNLFGMPFRLDVPAPAPKPGEKVAEPQLRRVGGGSGFIISADGLIVTNKHVVSDDKAVYKVVLSDGRELPATVIALDPVLDVGLIKVEKIDGKDFPVLELGDSDKIQIGQTVIAIGYALAEFGNTVTKGVVSGTGRHVEAGNPFGQREVLEEAIQTDTAINPGNSGGPLLDLSGKVIGVNTAVSQQGQLVGFAIPINTLKRTIESVQKNGRIIRPWLGVRYLPVTPLIAEQNNLSVKYGALILSGNNKTQLPVVPGSPADKAGLVENDIILEINGLKLEDKDSLPKQVARFNVGDEITLKVLSKGKEKEVKVKLEEFPVNP